MRRPPPSSGSTATRLTPRQAADPLPRRRLAGAGLLDVRRRAPAHRRPDAGRHARRRGVPVPVRRDDRLHDRAPAGVPRGRARARAGDPGRRGPAAQLDVHAVPALRLRGREATSCAARAACASSRTRAWRAASRWTPTWTICPYCEAEIPGSDPAPRRAPARRRQRPTPDGAAPLEAPPQPSPDPSKETHGPDPDPGQARRLRARPDRRDHRPLRAQGPADRGAQAHDARQATRQAALRRARRASRSSASSSSSSPRGPLVAMVLEGHEAVKAARQVIGATNPLEAAHRLDPRRLRDRGRPEHGPRLRTPPSRPRARPRCSSPSSASSRPARLVLASRSPQRRAILEQLGRRLRGAPAGRGGARRRATRARSARRERAAQGRGRRRRRASSSLGVRHARRARRRDLGKPADAPGAPARRSGARRAHARGRQRRSRCCAGRRGARRARA